MTTAGVDRAGAGPASWRTGVRIAAWWLLVGAASGAVAGVVIGGIGGRLAMLVLRQQSPGAVGLTSDAGFEIGRVTLSGSLGLAAFAAVAGGLFGLVYLAVRLAVPAPARLTAATLLGATVGGAAFIEPDGIDLLVLDPLWFAVSAFIALAALAALATALAVERLARRAPLTPPAARPPVPPAVALTARVVVAALVVAVVVSQGLALAREVAQVL